MDIDPVAAQLKLTAASVGYEVNCVVMVVGGQRSSRLLLDAACVSYQAIQFQG